MKTYRRKKSNILTALRKRFKTRGLFTALAIVSIIGFAGNTLRYLVGFDPFEAFSYAAILLGVGLMFEAQIKEALSTRKPQSYMITKIVTFLVGLAVLVGGVLTIPLITFSPPEWFTGMIVFANIIAIFVIFMEAFLVD